MVRRISLCIFTIFAMLAVFFPSVGFATENNSKTVLGLVYIGNEGVSDEGEMRDTFYKAIDKEILKHKNVMVVPAEQAQNIFDEFLMENDLTPDDTQSNRGFLPKKAYLAEMAQQANADYVLLINARITDTKVKNAWLSFSGYKFEVTVLYNVLLYSVAEGKYIYNEKISVKENAAGSSSTERAFKKASHKFLETHFDLSNISLDGSLAE